MVKFTQNLKVCFLDRTPDTIDIDVSNWCHFVADATGYKWLWGFQGQRISVTEKRFLGHNS